MRRLDHQVKGRITAAVKRFAETGHGDVIALQGLADEYRLRVGQWRVLIHFDRIKRVASIHGVVSRDQAYHD
ncbi:MAG: type II toxin-antitoxin system RelE/ParE family toxin [Candidatus Poribacteria bacterium]|nr:type II toxin-antitoxin system RelE/ParE family toxin [Candidatus Poribacteria bacterium]